LENSPVASPTDLQIHPLSGLAARVSREIGAPMRLIGTGPAQRTAGRFPTLPRPRLEGRHGQTSRQLRNPLPPPAAQPTGSSSPGKTKYCKLRATGLSGGRRPGNTPNFGADTVGPRKELYWVAIDSVD
jgi:hypothetical protein